MGRRFLTLDIETVPDEELVSAVDGEPSRPYSEQLSRVLADRRARSGGRSDFLPLPFHRPIAACGLEAVEDGGEMYIAALHSWNDGGRADGEAEFLRRTWHRMAGRTLVTFRGRGFDLPVLELRSLKLGVPAPRWFQARRGGGARHLDLFDLLSGDGAATAPLDLYAKLLGLPGKQEVAGKDVQALYQAGALDRIAGYCMTDVVQTYLLFLRWRFLEGSLTDHGYCASARRARDDLPGLFARLGPGERAVLDGWLERCAAYFGETAAAAERRLA